jgi:4-hydroxythreonine-4-phosphate dehydrogenase
MGFTHGARPFKGTAILGALGHQPFTERLIATKLPLIAVTLGDPAGVGPEVVAKALTTPETSQIARTLVVGSTPVLNAALALIDSAVTAKTIAYPTETVEPGEIAVLETDATGGLQPPPCGTTTAESGAAAVDWLVTAGRLAMDGLVDGIATAPINKEAASMAGHVDIGHQEIYQSMTGAPQVVTMLVTSGLRVVHLTTHRSLRIACDYVTKENVLLKLRLMHEFFTGHGFAYPRIAAAALNPHAGEAGIIGSEEIEEIAPGVEAARREGIDATGPISADAVFNQAIDGRFDVVLAMYHDQGHIPIKVHDWAASATMNLGLPFLRTSVDHGTAFDIAGQGIADATGMVQALRLAAVVAGKGSLAGF